MRVKKGKAEEKKNEEEAEQWLFAICFDKWTHQPTTLTIIVAVYDRPPYEMSSPSWVRYANRAWAADITYNATVDVEEEITSWNIMVDLLTKTMLSTEKYAQLCQKHYTSPRPIISFLISLPPTHHLAFSQAIIQLKTTRRLADTIRVRVNLKITQSSAKLSLFISLRLSVLPPTHPSVCFYLLAWL